MGRAELEKETLAEHVAAANAIRPRAEMPFNVFHRSFIPFPCPFNETVGNARTSDDLFYIPFHVSGESLVPWLNHAGFHPSYRLFETRWAARVPRASLGQRYSCTSRFWTTLADCPISAG